MTNKEWGKIVDRYVAEGRTVSGGKGEQDSLKQQELANQQKQLQLQQEALSTQHEFTRPVLQAGQPYLTPEGQGFTPQQLAAMNTQFLNSQSQNFNAAQGAVTNALRAHGFMGSLPSTGDAARQLASLWGLNAATTSAGLTDIQLQNAQQAIANKFNTMGIFAGTGGNYGNQAVGLGNVATNFGQIAFNAGVGRPGFFETLGNAFASTLGKGLAGGALGGLGGGLAGFSSGSSGAVCWIAERIYGPDDFRTMVIRAYMRLWESSSLLGKVVVGLYRRFGSRVAKYPRLCRLLRPLFDHALNVACHDERLWV